MKCRSAAQKQPPFRRADPRTERDLQAIGFEQAMTSPIDAMYGGFADELRPALRPLARNLPHVLGLVPAPDIPWSEVFSHRVTLEAPALVAEAFPQASAELLRHALFAHALSVIQAFGVDRVTDNQVLCAPELLEVLKELRRARNRLLDRTVPGGAELGLAADREAAKAIREERSLLSGGGPATLEDYHRISLGKQAMGFPPSVAFAIATGTPQQVERVRRMLSGAWLGLQFERDASDWEADWKRGTGAWAVSLARRRLELVRQESAAEQLTDPGVVRQRVFKMRVLYSILRSARRQYRRAWRYARSLGAYELEGWAKRRCDRLDGLLAMEERYPGFVVRARELAPWAAEVLRMPQ